LDYLFLVPTLFQELLSTFLSQTGRKDRQLAIRTLEQHNWDLNAALQSVGASPPARYPSKICVQEKDA
jgi:hypothetical protein